MCFNVQWMHDYYKKLYETRAEKLTHGHCPLTDEMETHLTYFQTKSIGWNHCPIPRAKSTIIYSCYNVVQYSNKNYMAKKGKPYVIFQVHKSGPMTIWHMWGINISKLSKP